MNKALTIFAVIFALAVSFFLWSLSYGMILAYLYKDPAVLNALVKNPLVAAQQLYVYRDNIPLRWVGIYALLPAFLAFSVLTFMFIRPKQTPFGNAAFATAANLRANRAFRRKGIILGRFGRKIIRINDARHHLIIGPTRSGKGANYVVPNMLEYTGSMVVTDLKGELWTQTSQRRKAMGQTVFFFAPGSPKTHRYNPMDFIRPERGERVNDIQNMAQILIPEDKNSNSAVWAATSRNILAGVISYVQESSDYHNRRNLGEVNALLSTDQALQAILERIVKTDKGLSKFTTDSFNAFIALTDKGAQSALLDLGRALSIFKNERILAATTVTDIDIRALQRKPVTIYLAPNVADMTIIMPILRLFLQQTLNQLVLVHDKSAREVLFLLDEFRQLGQMDEIVGKLPYVAGYNIKMAFIIQDLKSLDDIYGESARQSLLGNCGYQLVLGANDQTTAEYVSKALGKMTVEYATVNRQMVVFGLHQRTKVHQMRDRDLMMPQEVRQMPESKLVVLVEGNEPILGTKIRAYKERPWAAWMIGSENAVTYPEATQIPVYGQVPALSPRYGKGDALSPMAFSTNERIPLNSTTPYIDVSEPETLQNDKENQMRSDIETVRAINRLAENSVEKDFLTTKTAEKPQNVNFQALGAAYRDALTAPK